jgi:hypothetical protein
MIAPSLSHRVLTVRRFLKNRSAQCLNWSIVARALVLRQVWVPLVDTDECNGCMQVVPRSHRLGGVPSQMDPDYKVLLANLPRHPTPRPAPPALLGRRCFRKSKSLHRNPLGQPTVRAK